MIEVFSPSQSMALSFHTIAAGIEGYAQDKWRQDRDQKHTIDMAWIGGLELLLVNNAKKHCDEFGWTALWCLRSSGHVLHTQDRKRSPTKRASHVMTAGRIYLFNSSLPHWTENGAATLICAAIDFSGDKPADSVIHARFDKILEGLRDRKEP